MAMYRLLALAVPINVLAETMAQQSDIPIQQSIEIEEDEQVTTIHKTDSVTILMLLGLLMFTILTVWLFKHRRFRFLHESGLSLIYGMLVGVAIRYASPPSTNDIADGVIVNNSRYTIKNRPDSVYIKLPQSLNTSIISPYKMYRYDLKGEVKNEVSQEPALERAVTFDPELFFNVLLPVIIFEAGYSMKRRHFFRNLGAIMCYAFIGTTISCVVVGGIMYGLTRLMAVQFSLNDCFFFGAIISATDPVTVLAIFNDLNVDVDLYALIFGESVLNDAVAIVLSGSVEKYGKLSQGGFSAEAFFKSLGNFVGIFAGAFAIGSLLGCITALYITKFTKIGEHPLLETALFFLMSYSSFQAAEAIGLTGIVAVLFCGVTQAHYTYNNLSANSKTRTKQLFELLNFLAENFVFLYIGVSIFTFQSQKWHAGFIFSAVLAIVVARFFNIYPLSLLLNIGRKNKLKASFMHMMMFAGLRGAIAYALSIRNTSNEARQLMVSATMLIVLITVIFCGGLTTPMLQWLQIRVGVEDQETSNLASGSSAAKRPRQYSSMESPVNESLPPASDLYQQDEYNTNQQRSPLLEEGNGPPRKKDKAFFVAKWHNFDIRFMKPLLTNSRPSLIETLPSCCMRIGQILTTEEQLSSGDSRIEEDSDTDMIIDHRELSIGEDSNSISTVSQPQFTTVDVNKDQTQNFGDESVFGDLGLGHSSPVSTRVNVPGPPGESV